MNINKYIKNIWVAACILMGSTLFNSCTDELDGKSVINTGTEGINLSISVDGMREKVLTRVDIDNRRANIHDINIVFADAEEKIVDIVRITAENATTNPSIDAETTGLVSADFETGDISYHIGTTDMESKEFTDIYVVANLLNEKGELIEIPSDVTTVQRLKELRQGVTYATAAGQYCTMFGKAEANSGNHEHTGGSTYKVSLKRTVAMITLGIDGSGLRQGVIIEPTKVELCNVPATCSISEDVPNMPDDEEDSPKISPSGQGIDIRWSPIACAEMGDGYIQQAPNDDPHGAESSALYMFENLQGQTDNTEDKQIDKEPLAEKKDYCSYIKVSANYYYRSESDNETDKANFSVNNLTGTITYNFYLGNNIYNDFNIKRNTHYKLTLNLQGWGGLVEEGVVTSDGSYDSGKDESWRVETDFPESGFISEGMNVPVGGSLITIPFVNGDINTNTNIRYDNDLGGHGPNAPFWAQKVNGEWEKGSTSDKLYDLLHDEGNGISTLRIYVRPVTESVYDQIISLQNITTMKDWIERGYYELTITVQATSDKFVIRQWLPLPILEPNIFGNISDPMNANPLNAQLFYSRFDILEGEMMPWCPDAYYNSNLGYESAGSILVMNPNDLGIIDPDGSEAREFNPEYGFHNQVAFFLTDRENNNVIDFKNGQPTSMMEYTIFTSVNAENPGSGENTTSDMVVMNPNDATGMHHYALASKEEWLKIEQYGVRDPRFPLVPGTPYWTSSISEDGTKTYVHYYNGGDEVKDRANSYRGRMVYHKNNNANF